MLCGKKSKTYSNYCVFCRHMYNYGMNKFITVKEASKEHKAIKESLDAINNTVAYVNFDKAKMEGTFVRYPERSELSAEINEPLIVEYYSR